MAEPETEANDISLRAAEVASDVTETDQPQERRRLLSAFTRAVGSGARAAGRGTRAAGRGAGSGTRTVRQRASAITSYLTIEVIKMAPRLRVRDRAALQARFPGKSADEIADALIEGAARAAATTGAAAGAVSTLPVLPTFPAEIVAETLVVVGIEIKLVAELHEAYGTPAPGRFSGRMSTYLAAWAHRRGVDMIPGGVVFAAGSPADAAATPPPGRPGGPQRVLAGTAAHRRRRGRLLQRQGNQEARPANPGRPAPPRDRPPRKALSGRSGDASRVRAQDQHPGPGAG